MPSCYASLLGCLIGLAVGIGIIVCFRRLRDPVCLAQTYHVDIDGGLFTALPIYRYLRRYLLVMLFAGVVAVLVSTVFMVEGLLGVLQIMGSKNSCDKPDTGVAGLILAIFGVHMSATTCFEVGSRHRPVPQVKEVVDKLGRRLWGVAVLLLVAFGLLYSVAAWAA